MLLALSVIILSSAYSQENITANNEEVKIKTSAVCEMCKERIEEEMSTIEGVSSSNLDVDTKILTVNFNPAKITADDIRKAITKIGYDADDMAASKKAYNKLPKCCKKDGHAK